MKLGIVLAVLLSALAAGCGSGDGESKKDFVQMGNAVCVKSNTQTGEKILLGYKRPEFLHARNHREAINLEVVLFMPILIADAEKQLAGLRALHPPGDDEEKFEQIFTAYEKWLEKAKATPLQVIFGANVFSVARELAGKYGMTKCASSPYEEPYVHN